MRHDRLRTLILGLAPLLAIALPSTAAADRDWGITLYSDGNYQGTSETFDRDVARLDRTTFGQDRASSVRVSRGCTVTLYGDANFRGRSMTLSQDVHSLAGSAVGNDSVSSMEIDCRRNDGDIDWGSRRGVALYSDADFRGRQEIFTRDDNDLRNNRIGNDAASSLRIAPGCQVTLYSDKNFLGRFAVIRYDNNRLGHSKIGNDSVSSLRVECSRRRDRERRSRNRRTPRTAPGSVTLFTDGDYDGRYETFYRDVPSLGRTEVGNDTASSILVGRGCRVILFEHADYRGRSEVIDGDTPDLYSTSLGNDRASSMRLDCGRGGYGNRPRYGDPRDGGSSGGGPFQSSRDTVTLFSGEGYRGNSARFDRSVRNLGDSRIGNDAVRSVRVAPGCRVTLYRDADFRGRSAVIINDTPDLQFTSVGNGQASSIEVDCRRR